MKNGAKYLIGKHDFTSFRDAECQAKSPIKSPIMILRIITAITSGLIEEMLGFTFVMYTGFY